VLLSLPLLPLWLLRVLRLPALRKRLMSRLAHRLRLRQSQLWLTRRLRLSHRLRLRQSQLWLTRRLRLRLWLRLCMFSHRLRLCIFSLLATDNGHIIHRR
jgi:hypothetical protein